MSQRVIFFVLICIVIIISLVIGGVIPLTVVIGYFKNQRNLFLNLVFTENLVNELNNLLRKCKFIACIIPLSYFVHLVPFPCGVSLLVNFNLRLILIPFVFITFVLITLEVIGGLLLKREFDSQVFKFKLILKIVLYSFNTVLVLFLFFIVCKMFFLYQAYEMRLNPICEAVNYKILSLKMEYTSSYLSTIADVVIRRSGKNYDVVLHQKELAQFTNIKDLVYFITYVQEDFSFISSFNTFLNFGIVREFRVVLLTIIGGSLVNIIYTCSTQFWWNYFNGEEIRQGQKALADALKLGIREIKLSRRQQESYFKRILDTFNKRIDE